MIDIKVAWSDADRLARGFSAAEATLNKTGHGVSYYRTRPQLPGETQRPARPWLILGIIAKRRGRDPLDPPMGLEHDLLGMLREEVQGAIAEAIRTERTQRSRITRALLGGARDMREDAQERMLENRTGFIPTTRYQRRKQRAWALRRAGKEIYSESLRNVSLAYGRTPPPLILSGRLWHSMTERWYEVTPRRVRT